MLSSVTLNTDTSFIKSVLCQQLDDISCRFGLFEAMSAIEMMDPKMDAGMIGNQVNRKVLNLEQAIKVHSHVIVIQ